MRRVAQGARAFDELVSGRMADSLLQTPLTPREHQVLQSLARGDGNKTIADELGIAVGTVKVHIKGLLDKLGVRTRMQAAALASAQGLLRVPHPQPAAAPGLQDAGCSATALCA